MSGDPLRTAAARRVGQVLRGKWRLEGLLGVGGMAAVFAATHRNGKRVAIKILHAQIAIDPSIQHRFLREGYVANSIGHEGAVSVLDDDVTDDGAVFLVMELLEGETLDARATRLGGCLPLNEVVSFTDQLLDVLVAAHSKGIIHRDIKPENLFLTTKGQLKVLDFGIARLLERAGSTAATKTGSMLGTPAFMPPEQALGHVKDVDQQSDIWAVGAVMYTLLTGSTVHPGTTVNEQLIAAATKPVVSISTGLPDLPPFFARIIDRALAFEKRNRWDDAADMLDALREAGETTTLAVDASPATVLNTLAAAPRTSQMISQPEILAPAVSARGCPPIPTPGTQQAPVGQRAPIPDTRPRAPAPTVADPTPTKSSGMAVGRTLTEPSSRGRLQGKWLLAVVGGSTALAALAVGGGVLVLGDAASGAPSGTPGLVAPATKPAASSSSARASTEGSNSLDPNALPVVAAIVEIVSHGGDCNVVVDGRKKGATPLRALELPVGEHEIRCEAAGISQVETLEARAGERHTVEFFVSGSKAPPPGKSPAKPPPVVKTAAPAKTTAPPVATKTVNPLDIR